MTRKGLIVLSAALLVSSCGGNKGAEPATAGDDSTVSEPGGGAGENLAATSDESESVATDQPEGAVADESAAAETEVSTEAPVSPAAEETSPSDDLQSYVGTSGAYTPEYRTVTDNMDIIKQCYIDAIRVDPDIQGTLKVRFTVNKAGKVSKAKAVTNELNEQVATCVIGTLKKLKFPKRADNRTVEYPFKFIPGP